MGTRSEQDPIAGPALGVAGGFVVVVVVALAATVVSEPAEQGVRLLMMAVAAGVLARFVADWRASLAVTAVAAAIFVGFLAGADGDLTGGSVWPLAVVIGFAALLGRGQRWMRAVHAHDTGSVTGTR